jgi:hypothetical protein
MLGYLIDESEFQVKPAISRVTQLVEIDTSIRKSKRKDYPENPNDFPSNFLFLNGNSVLTDVIDFTADMSFVNSDNVDTYDVYINNDYYGTDIPRIQITTNDILRIEITRIDSGNDASITFESSLV